jgi:site-specific DNA-cytosine methylase
MTSPRVYKVVTFFSGLGAKTLGLLRARSQAGSRFESIGAFDVDPVACKDFEILTGAMAQVVDLGTIKSWELAKRCEGVPDVVVMSPPCKGFSGCLPESLSKLEKYEALNRLALQSVKLAIKAWPKLILLENVPRMITRGADWLAKITKLLRKAGYEVSLEPHDCGEWGGLAQKRERLLLIARLRSACPSHLLRPPSLGLRPMASVLWQLPPPVPGSTAGGPHHRLPEINALNWLRLSAIPATQDWRAIPERVHLVDVDPRLPEDGKRHAGKYGPQDPSQPAHTVIAEARTGKGWADVADPRLDDRGSRQNGGYGVNDSGRPSHSVLAEGSVRNTWSSVSDPRAEPRFADCIRKGPLEHDDGAIDPRSTCSRFEDAIGVSDAERPYKTPVIGHQKVENSPSSVADPRVIQPRVPAQNRGNFGIQDPRRPSATIRAQHPIRTAPSSVADGRELFRPTHDLVAGQPWTGDRDAWVRGDFRLVGPEVAITKGGRGCYLIIRSFDGTVHRPMTTAELMLLQGVPVWHRPGDPTELALDDPTGQWVQLGGSDALVREHVGNAVPVPTAQAIGEVMLEVLDAGASEVFRLSSGGIWVQPEAMAAA